MPEVVYSNLKDGELMKVVIVGCGKIGRSILKNLTEEGHSVCVIDRDPKVVRSIGDDYDVMCVNASGTDIEALKRAEVSSAELFIAASANDDANMLSCCFARSLGAAHTVARLNGAEHYTDADYIKRCLDISMIIDPDRLTSQAIFNTLKFPSAVRVESFTRHLFEMAELCVKPDSVLDGSSLAALRDTTNADFLICCILRDRKTYIPDGSFVLKAGDRIGLLAASDDMPKLLSRFGVVKKSAKNVMLIGGSRIAQDLAERLAKSGHHVKVIEKDIDRCHMVSGTLPRSVSIICGNGSRHELLDSEGIDDTDAFVSLTGIDEENILSAFYASGKNVPKVIAKVNQAGFVDISGKLGLDCVVSPSRITADIVTQYARSLSSSAGSSIETLYTLMDGSLEALEFAVSASFTKQGVELKDLDTKPGILIAGIIRGSRTIIPKGSDAILAGDKVIVIAAGERLCDLSDILQ